MTTASSSRLLLFKLGAIGDCIMAVPAAYAMHQAGYEVHWVCSPGIAPVLRLYPWLRVIPMDEAGLLRGSLRQRIASLAGIWRLVARERYTLCATLYYDPRYRLLALPVRAERKLMLSRTDRRTMLVPGRHHTDEYLRILTGRLDSETPGRTPPLRIEGLPPTAVARTEGRPRVVLVPGGARNLVRDNPLRRWPLSSYVELAAQLDACGYEVVLAGGPDDAWVLPAFAASNVIDCIGKLSLVETLSLLDSADVTVSHDTGPLHLAGVTRTAIVAIFGPTSPHVFCPQRAGVVALWGGETLACRPCYDGSNFAPCTNNGCVQQMAPALVLQHVERLLAAQKPAALPPMHIDTSFQTPRPIQL
jgi:heptosyltransferase-2